MEKVHFTDPKSGGETDFFVLEQTKIGGVSYILVTEQEEGDCEALILKDVSGEEDQEALYEIVESAEELGLIAGIFEELLEDVEIEN